MREPKWRQVGDDPDYRFSSSNRGAVGAVITGWDRSFQPNGYGLWQTVGRHVPLTPLTPPWELPDLGLLVPDPAFLTAHRNRNLERA